MQWVDGSLQRQDEQRAVGLCGSPVVVRSNQVEGVVPDDGTDLEMDERSGRKVLSAEVGVKESQDQDRRRRMRYFCQ